jgi:hypothetical protein
MTLLNNGQPIGGIIQAAYTVADIEAAVRSYAEDLRIGPWFLRGPLQARKPIYRGAPQNLMLSIAIAYSSAARRSGFGLSRELREEWLRFSPLGHRVGPIRSRSRVLS